VKPCPEDTGSGQGFSGSPVDGTTSRKEYKGYKNTLQVNVLYRLIEKLHVTLLVLSRHVVPLELERMSQ
jgi:hypothetical protein